LALGAPASTLEAVPETIQFNRDVRPILSEACFACHGPDQGRRKADQRFDTEAGLLAAQKSGVVVPGKPEKSELLVRVSSADRALLMPPPSHGRKLAGREIGVLRRWIEQGAKWQPHWAYVAPTRPQPPAQKHLSPTVGPIDCFLLAKLEQAG